jgi:hypothetical protein
MNKKGNLGLDVILILVGYAVGTVVFAYTNFLPRTEADLRAKYRDEWNKRIERKLNRALKLPEDDGINDER